MTKKELFNNLGQNFREKVENVRWQLQEAKEMAIDLAVVLAQNPGKTAFIIASPFALWSLASQEPETCIEPEPIAQSIEHQPQ